MNELKLQRYVPSVIRISLLRWNQAKASEANVRIKQERNAQHSEAAKHLKRNRLQTGDDEDDEVELVCARLAKRRLPDKDSTVVDIAD